MGKLSSKNRPLRKKAFEICLYIYIYIYISTKPKGLSGGETKKLHTANIIKIQYNNRNKVTMIMAPV